MQRTWLSMNIIIIFEFFSPKMSKDNQLHSFYNTVQQMKTVSSAMD